MPEGPEIRRAADEIAAVLVGNEIVDATFAFPTLKRFEAEVVGATVRAVDTRGKAMLTRFDNGLTLYSHNQLYGRWYTRAKGESPATNRSLRVALHTPTHSAMLYSASDVEMLTDAGLAEHPFLNRIGPDILDPDLTADNVAARLDDASFRRRSTGALYLDQAFLAGVGNYLRSEILFVSAVHPARRPVDLTTRERQRLARGTLTISRRSYRTKGVTVPRKQARARKAQGARFRDYRFWVFGRDGDPCYRCGTTIERMAVSSRGLFYCPRCQPMEPQAA